MAPKKAPQAKKAEDEEGIKGEQQAFDPNQTIYIKNLNEKIKKPGTSTFTIYPS